MSLRIICPNRKRLYKKSGRALNRGDKHKTMLTERRIFAFLSALAYDLEPLSPVAGHQEKRKGFEQRRQGYDVAERKASRDLKDQTILLK
jgi:hypothetical protein